MEDLKRALKLDALIREILATLQAGRRGIKTGVGVRTENSLEVVLRGRSGTLVGRARNGGTPRRGPPATARDQYHHRSVQVPFHPDLQVILRADEIGHFGPAAPLA